MRCAVCGEPVTEQDDVGQRPGAANHVACRDRGRAEVGTTGPTPIVDPPPAAPQPMRLIDRVRERAAARALLRQEGQRIEAESLRRQAQRAKAASVSPPAPTLMAPPLSGQN
jgi:hypothetical protein